MSSVAKWRLHRGETHVSLHWSINLQKRCAYCTFLGCVLRLDDPGQAKVCYLAVQSFTDQDVGCTHVSVDVVLPLDVSHAFSDLSFLGGAEEHFEATRLCTIWVFLLLSCCLVSVNYMQPCSSGAYLCVFELIFMYLTLTAEWFNRICQHLRKWKSFFWRGVRVLGGSLWMESSMISCPDVNNWHRARLTSQTSKSPPPPPARHRHTETTLRSWQFTSVYVKRWDKCLSCIHKYQRCNEWHRWVF